MAEILAKLASMSDILEKLIVLIIGWLLGLLGPAIVDGIRRKRENKLGRKAIHAEMHDLSGVLALVVYMVRLREGTVDREIMQWLKNCVDADGRSEQFKKWSLNLATQLSWSDEELTNFAAFGTQQDGKTVVMQKYPVPLLDSRVAALWSFDTSFQRRLLEIRQLMHRLDDLVDRSRKLQDMTFTSLTDENRALVEQNIMQTISFYGQTAKQVVDKINALEG
ncbi:hypothetical protein [Pseudoduganella buxea]|uniref:Uncharacterized protein n=1 Tax=Pseudoduganella buxea TaxID=1949069 RepID=A0A6I3T005_9BURK|nr:hypothetical protein [Pseudoduganella buxea]MTV54911.1 hypothetical protein [Pseudoduganella buxea]GGC23946.1 hypothetical protein GCM10011572_51820 [Pseudoduganella buxea]